MCPSCRLLATCSADQTCKIWRTSNFSLMTELSIKSNNPGETSRGWMWDCAFSGDSQYIVTGEAPPGLCQGRAPARPDQLPWLGHCQSLGHGGCEVGAPSPTHPTRSSDWSILSVLQWGSCLLERRSPAVLFVSQFTAC